MASHSPVTLDTYRTWGSYLLSAALLFSLSILALVIWQDPELAIYLPIVPAALIAVFVLFRFPLVNFGVVLMGFVLLTDYTAGFQITEILYGIYALLYLAHWFGSQLFVHQKRLVTSTMDRLLVFFLVLVALQIPVAVLFGARISVIMREWMALMLLAFYFPVKETIKQEKNGVRIVIVSILFIGLCVTLRNLINYREIVIGATQVWQVATNRISTNDNWLMVSSLLAFILLIFLRKNRHRLVMLGLFTLLLSGLIFSQSRGYWIAFIAGAGFMFVCVDWKYKRRLLGLGVSAGVTLIVLGLIFLQDFTVLVFSGLAHRLFTLQDAFSSDISLINRFRETAAVWAHIVRNPVLGYGIGVPFEFYDITTTVTQNSTFMHNGYISLWYKFGILGLGSFVLLWLGMIWAGLRAYRTISARASVRIAGLSAASILAAFLMSAITSNPFYLNDTLFAFALLLGTAGGACERALMEAG